MGTLICWSLIRKCICCDLPVDHIAVRASRAISGERCFIFEVPMTTPARIFDPLFVYPISAVELTALGVPASLLPVTPAIVSAVAVLSLISCPLITLGLV